ncbi:hypothetical protein QLH52_12860 [Methylomonas sp. OY6]|uniref:Uncharacterized protein n=1 Tax=Methylomonas defluvii TaxID=3045149 RepID=A0ABU4UFB6_9GAMM|nr:hypothetical protein [Methylomonas sp. OY6]MDX8128179.1 hypothetical protein [Methylomonas sp. OY6]
MKRRFTKNNINYILKKWPQAVSADRGDFRVLHDLANSGAQMWKESLRWPDYFWLGLESDIPKPNTSTKELILSIQDPSGQNHHADMGALKYRVTPLAVSGKYAVSNQIECFLEVKAIGANPVHKIKNYSPDIPWSKFLKTKLDHAFLDHLKHANTQIRDGKKIIGFKDARGIVVIVNEWAPSLNIDLACAYITQVIDKLEYIDAVIYLSDSPQKPNPVPLIVKNAQDSNLVKFHREFLIMLSSFSWENSSLSCKFDSKELVAEITMDSISKQMYGTWSAGWRDVDDPSPIPTPKCSISFVPADEYSSKLK